ncbi:hypothetical protein SDC9_103578 [bioreactor metagenome]|uniref:Uncharacterized protein n=1 Tax=bioreactor metagenome TaxID=1076179 RepID=A0A645B4W1_9ZZZZ
MLFFDHQRFFLDDGEQLTLVIENALQIVHALAQHAILFQNLIAFQTGQTLETHVQNRLRLPLGEAEALYELLPRLVWTCALLDEVYNLVDVVQRDDEAFQNMEALLRAVEVIGRAAGDNVFLMLEIIIEHIAQRQYLRFAIHQHEHDHAEGGLQIGVFIELVENDAAVDVLFQFDHDTHARAVGFITQVGDALNALFVHKLRNALHKPRLVHLIGDLGDDDAAPASAVGLDLRAGADDDAAPAGAVGARDPTHAHDNAAGRKIRAGQILHKRVAVKFRVIDQGAERVDRLAEVMRRDICRHADGDTAGTVDENIGISARQHGRLHERFVKVWHEVDGVLVDIRHHLARHLRQPRFGIAHRRRAVSVHTAEVAVAFYKHIARREILRKANHRVIDRGIAMRVIFAQAVADDTRALAEGFIRLQSQLVHRVENAPVDGL